jgi:Tetratricopeptide repeat
MEYGGGGCYGGVMGGLLVGIALDSEAVVTVAGIGRSGGVDTITSPYTIDLSALREYQAARALDEDTLARRRRVQGEDHPDTLASASNLATDLTDLGEHQAARALDEDTLARRRRVLGEGHPDTQQSVRNLAADLGALGQA